MASISEKPRTKVDRNIEWFQNEINFLLGSEIKCRRWKSGRYKVNQIHQIQQLGSSYSGYFQGFKTGMKPSFLQHTLGHIISSIMHYKCEDVIYSIRTNYEGIFNLQGRVSINKQGLLIQNSNISEMMIQLKPYFGSAGAGRKLIPQLSILPDSVVCTWETPRYAISIEEWPIFKEGRVWFKDATNIQEARQQHDYRMDKNNTEYKAFYKAAWNMVDMHKQTIKKGLFNSERSELHYLVNVIIRDLLDSYEGKNDYSI